MTKRYTTLELAELYDKKEWAALWKIITPMVKHEVRRCMQDGLDPFYVREDIMQEAYLAAWEALPRWHAFEASLRKWVGIQVRRAVLDANRRVSGGMIGGRDVSVTVVSMHGDTPESDGSDDEQEVPHAPEAKIGYENPPEGYRDPAEEGDSERLLLQVPERDRDMVRRLCGIGVPAETQQEYAVAARTTRKAVKERLARLRKKIGPFSLKVAK